MRDRFRAGGRAPLTALLVVLLAVALTGCSEPQRATEDAGSTVEAVPEAMPTEERDALPAGFPIEVPAMDGTVTEVDTADENVGPWFYEMESPHERDEIAGWYLQAYTGRSWQLADDATGTTERVLILTKGAGAWSTVRVHETDGGSRIECWTGIGVPMPPEALPPTGAPATEV